LDLMKSRRTVAGFSPVSIRVSFNKKLILVFIKKLYN